MRPIVIRVTNRQTGSGYERTYSTSPVRIGRNQLNELSLDYPFVSGWHAVIRFDDDHAAYYDLGSTNGTLFHGLRLDVGQAVTFDEAVSVQLSDIDLTLSRGQTTLVGEVDRPRTWMRGSEGDIPRAGTINAPTNPPEVPPPGPFAASQSTIQLPMRQMHEAIDAIRPYYDAFVQAQQAFEAQLQYQLQQLPPTAYTPAEALFRREFPHTQAQARRKPSASSGYGDTGLATLAERLLPNMPPPSPGPEAEQFVERVGAVVETFAKGVVELQSGQEQFGREMGVRTIKEFTPLHVAGSVHDVLNYLLDIRQGGSERVQELGGVFSDVMIHQIALLNGVAAGGRALLHDLDPDEIERQVGAGWSKKLQQRWDSFVRRYRQLTENDRLVTERLFGSEFARAYGEVGGERRDRDPTSST